MNRPKRTKLVLETLEKRLAKNERRIQAIATESYQIREAIAQFKTNKAAQEAKPEEKEIEEQLNEPVEE
jgi:hypothetical protein